MAVPSNTTDSDIVGCRNHQHHHRHLSTSSSLSLSPVSIRPRVRRRNSVQGSWCNSGCCCSSRGGDPTDGMMVRRPSSATATTATAAADIVSEGFIEVVFLLLGVGILLPWNAYISAKQYFESRLCDDGIGGDDDDDDGNGGSSSGNIEMWFSIVYNGGTVLSLAVVILVQYLMDDSEGHQPQQPQQQQQRIHPRHHHHHTDKIGSVLVRGTSNLTNPMSPMSTKTVRIDPTKGEADYTWYMVMIPLALYLTVFAITTISVLVPSIKPTIFWYLTLLGLFVCGICTAVAGSGIVGTAGLFEPDVGINPFFNGQAVGGLLVACGNFFASVVDGPERYLNQHCPAVASITTTTTTSSSSSRCVPYSEVSWATAGYFSVGCLVLAASMVGYSYVDEYKRLARSAATNGHKYSPIIMDRHDDCNDDYDDIDDGNDDHEDKREGHHDDHRNGHNPHHNHDDVTSYVRRKRPILNHLSMEDTPITTEPSSSSSSSPGRVARTMVPGGSPIHQSKWRKRASVSFASYQNGDLAAQVYEYDNDNDDHDNRIHDDTGNINGCEYGNDITGGEDDENADGTQYNLTTTVWTAVRGTAGALFLTYLCTLAVFPVWTSELTSVVQCESPSRIRNDLFTPFSFLLFNAGDLVGRSMSGMVHLDTTKNVSSKLVWGSVIRLIFFILFLSCKAQSNWYESTLGTGRGYTSSSSWMVVNDTDTFSWSIQFLFAVTNGFFTNLAFCYAPSLVTNEAHPQQVASAILNFALSFGLLVGSFCSGPYLHFASGIW